MEQYQAGQFGFPAQVATDEQCANDLRVAEDVRERRIRAGGLTVAENYKERRKCIDCDKRHATGCLRCQKCQAIQAGADRPVMHRSFVVTRQAA